MNLIGYLRVSTEEQVRNGNGLDIQRAQCQAWAQVHGHTITRWISDEGVSGSLLIRPGLVDLYDALDAPDVSGVVAQADTRYSRSLEGQEGFFGRCWAKGKHIFTVQVGEILEDDPADPMRTAMRQMRGVMAQLDAGLIRQRLQAGRDAARASGRFPGGPTPFGWRLMDGALVQHTSEQRTLHRIKDWRTEGKSMYFVVKSLNDEGITTSSGSKWTITTLKRMLPPGVHPSERSAHETWLYDIFPTEVSA